MGQSGRSGGVAEASVGGQARFVPAFMERVREPQVAQKGARAFQSRYERAWANIAAIRRVNSWIWREKSVVVGKGRCGVG